MDLVKFKYELNKCIKEGLLQYSELNETELSLLKQQEIAEEVVNKIRGKFGEKERKNRG